MGGITLFCAEEPREMSTRYMQRRIAYRGQYVLGSTRNAACRIAYCDQLAEKSSAWEDVVQVNSCEGI